MESRKRLFKAGPRDHVTLTERIKKTRNNQMDARNNRFNKGRQISVDDSPGITTPKESQNAVKISEITDRRQKLQAYRIQRNTQKMKEVQEQITSERSPFICVVPTGRWIMKKEKTNAIHKFGLNDTPVRSALANERVLKKSTIKKLMITGTTAKKENYVAAPSKSTTKLVTIKSKKKILADFNSLPSSDVPEDLPFTPLEPVDMNSTFEISPEATSSMDLPSVESPKALKRRSKSDSSVPKNVKVDVPKTFTPIVKAVIKKPVARPAPKVVLRKPLIAIKPVRQVQVRREVVKKQPSSAMLVKKPIVPFKAEVPSTLTKKSRAAQGKPTKIVEVKKKISPKPVKNIPSAEDYTQPPTKPKAEVKSKKKQEPKHSVTYNLYKSSLDTQIRYLSMQLQEIETNKPLFFNALLDHEQMMMNKTVQQTNLLITDKLGKFGKLLEQFEGGQNDPEARKRLSEDDVENYWYLIYDEIEKLKEDLIMAHEIMKGALRAVASVKRRRTRKNHVVVEGTPKRSLRIADNADTPKHDCYGCVTMSASKVNTPRSASKRRTTIKKSVLFDVETPKRADSNRRSSRTYKGTPKRNLTRMNAIDNEEEDEDFVYFP